MRLPRPYIPLEIRCQVVIRQLGLNPLERVVMFNLHHSYGAVLAELLHRLTLQLGCSVGELQLDHDPALQNRTKVFKRGKHVDYIPHANHPDYLIYRVKADHSIKTRVRGDHGQFADNVIAKRERRRLKKKTKRKHRWARGRKLRSRNNLRRRREP